MLIIEGIGVRDEFPAQDFVVHAAEGVRDLAFAPLKARGEMLGALTVGYRSPHPFTDEEKELLQDLAEMAATSLDNSRLLETVTSAKRIWEQTFDAIGEGILVHDYQMQIVRCNARAAEMMEMQPAEVIGLSFSEVFARLFGKRAAAYYLTESRGASSVFEVETEGGRRYLVSIFPLQHPEGDSVSVVTWTDVTRFLEMKDQLSRSRRLASVGELAAGVAHEINNPLAAITTCAEATMRDMRQKDETQALADSHQWSYYLQEIVRQALRCKEITRGLLDLTRQRQANRVMCDFNAIAAQGAKVAMQRGNSAAIEFEITLDENTGEVATDAAMVRQVLDNLLSNAIDALGEGSGRISVSTARDGDRVVIDVADTGKGIPANSLAKIFEPFFSTKGPGKGYGLGLAISLTLAESLGGSLTVESKEGAGSRFRLWIPRRAPEQQHDRS
jgi:PAS domain S-box-containing protein